MISVKLELSPNSFLTWLMASMNLQSRVDQEAQQLQYESSHWVDSFHITGEHDYPSITGHANT
jgi:hypothetical protein